MKYPIKDYVKAYLKAIGIFIPTAYIWRPFGEVLEVDRCVVDGGLVTNSQESLSRHGGHRMKGPVIISIFEMFLIWVRIIR